MTYKLSTYIQPLAALLTTIFTLSVYNNLLLSYSSSNSTATTAYLLTLTILCVYLLVLPSIDDVFTFVSSTSLCACALLLLCSTDIVTVVLLFELLNVPLCILIVYRLGSLHTGTQYVVKGPALAVLLLLGYGLTSGVLLWLGVAFHVSSLSVVGVQSVYSWSSVVCLSIGAAVKVALVPTHVWLGKVHVECSTVGSVLLAGVALKVGWYLHTLLASELGACMEHVYVYYIVLVALLTGCTYTSVSLFRQMDIKRWIALYSVSHMQIFYSVWLMCGCSDSSTMIVSLGMYAHSMISSGMFFLAGSVVDVSGSRSWSDQCIGSVTRVQVLALILLNSSIPGSLLLLVEVRLLGVCVHTSLYYSLTVVILSLLSLITGLYYYMHSASTRHDRLSTSDLVLVCLTTWCIAVNLLLGLSLLV